MAGLGYTFYEFFAGGGMAHAGLGTGNWDCLLANDFDRKKCDSYARNWGDDALVCGDVAKLSAALQAIGQPGLDLANVKVAVSSARGGRAAAVLARGLVGTRFVGDYASLRRLGKRD